MENYKDFYILGEPIETEIGTIRFLKVSEYPYFIVNYLPYLELQRYEVLAKLYELDFKLGKAYKDKSFIEIIHELSENLELYEVYSEMFEFLFNEDVFYKIKTDEEFDNYKDLIIKMNCVSIEEKNPNPEIQYYNDLEKILNKSRGNNITFESIYTSVWLKTGINPISMTVYEMYALFYRIMQEKNFDTSVLYSTVSTDVKIDLWYKHIDLVEEEKKELISLEDIKTQAKEFKRN